VFSIKHWRLQIKVYGVLDDYDDGDDDDEICKTIEERKPKISSADSLWTLFH